MFTFFTAAARFRDLIAITGLVWQTHLAPGQRLSPEAPVVANAIAFSILTEPAGPYDDETTAALLAEFAFKESGIQAHPCAHTKSPTCGDSGLAHGYWQLHQPSGEETAERQAASWLALLRQSAAVCPGRPLAMVASGQCDLGTRIADARLKAAQAAVNTWRNAQQAAERPAEAPPAAAPVPAAALSEAAPGRP